MFKIYLLAGVALLGLCGTTDAQGRRGRRQQGDNTQQTPLTAERFVMIASSSGLAEVAFGKMAANKAAADDVKRFGQQMVEDHTKADKQLKQIAENKQIPFARSMDRKHQEMERRLSSLSGAAFDREYIMSQMKDHQDAVALFTKMAELGTDSELKAFAVQTLPTLKEHLEMVKKLADKVK